MDVRQEYEKKLCSAEEAVKVVQSGDWIDYGWNACAPVALDRALAARYQELWDVKVRGAVLLSRPAILSVPEGHDKPLKYPLVFQVCDTVLINKIDVAPYFDFDFDKCCEYIHVRNPKAKIFPISAKTGEGMEAVAAWLKEEVKNWKGV